MFRTKADLLALASRYANERRVPFSTIIKEILHYEILYAMAQSEALSQLTFQGGTALRLCYRGTRYSEDLDFACSESFHTDAMKPFAELLQKKIAAAYDLDVEIKKPKFNGQRTAEVSVARWSAKILVPQTDPSVPQNQVINIEVANVRAYEPDLVAVNANYPHLPAPLQQMIIATETPTEILADKIVALVARPYLKARDVWDIKFLLDRQTVPDFKLVRKKLLDYGWTTETFKSQMNEKIELLAQPDTTNHFYTEMSRFVDATVLPQLKNPSMANMFLRKSIELGQQTIAANLG
jgi:predicted nucleotidyltransferase component of viral defense system